MYDKMNQEGVIEDANVIDVENNCYIVQTRGKIIVILALFSYLNVTFV